MIQIAIPEDLFESIKKVAPPSVSPETYVTEVLRKNVGLEEQKKEFYRLSDETLAAVKEKGLKEEEILKDFETFREELKTDG